MRDGTKQLTKAEAQAAKERANITSVVGSAQKHIDRPGKSTKYKGVTQHRRTGRYESHLWLNKRGRQMYVGSFDTPEYAAEAYDVAALKRKGLHAKINYPLTKYVELLRYIDAITLEELVLVMRRQAPPVIRPLAEPPGIGFKGVAQKDSNRFSAFIKLPNQEIPLGEFDSAEEAARAYDRAVVQQLGPKAITNFPMHEYQSELEAYFALNGSGRAGNPQNAAMLAISAAADAEEDRKQSMAACSKLPPVLHHPHHHVTYRERSQPVVKPEKAPKAASTKQAQAQGQSAGAAAPAPPKPQSAHQLALQAKLQQKLAAKLAQERTVQAEQHQQQAAQQQAFERLTSSEHEQQQQQAQPPAIPGVDFGAPAEAGPGQVDAVASAPLLLPGAPAAPASAPTYGNDNDGDVVMTEAGDMPSGSAPAPAASQAPAPELALQAPAPASGPAGIEVAPVVPAAVAGYQLEVHMAVDSYQPAAQAAVGPALPSAAVGEHQPAAQVAVPAS